MTIIENKDMNKICTSLKQSKKLIELGINIHTADMYWLNAKCDEYLQSLTPYISDDYLNLLVDIPAWSLVALLNVLPQGTRLLKSESGEMYHCDCPKENIDKWFNNPIDACVEMIVKLKKKGLI